MKLADMVRDLIKVEKSMEKDSISVSEYFNSRSRDAPESVVTCAINGLVRGRVETMEQLLGKTPEELARVRNIGVKSLELILSLRDQYAAEKNPGSKSK